MPAGDGYRRASLLTDGVWWFYLFWLPKFLDARYGIKHGIKLGKLALPLIVIYIVADYRPVFLACGLAYVRAFGIMHVLAPRLEPVRLT